MNLKKYINRKEVPKNGNPEEIMLKKVIDFKTNEKVKDVHEC